VSTSEAREVWQRLRRQRLNGQRPSLNEGAGDANIITIEELVRRYLAEYARKVKRPSSASGDERMLTKHLLPDFGKLPATELNRDHVAAILLGIKERGAPREAEKVRAVLLTMFNVARGKTRKISLLAGTWLPSESANPVDTVMLEQRKSSNHNPTTAELRSYVRGLDDLGVYGDTFQDLLAAGERRVIVPFAPVRAKVVPTRAVRLRRDFSQILNLVAAHALLHRGHRVTDSHGRIIATIEDYREVHRLLADQLAEATGIRVPQSVRETYEAVQALTTSSVAGIVNAKQVGDKLRIDRSTASRRLNAAVGAGLIENEENRPHRPGRYRCIDGAEITDTPVLPSPEALEALVESADLDQVPPKTPARLHAHG
jgi:hypothetical protein